ncbi:MAG: DUF6477 family protein [Rhodobacteraceae bacterium]|jgi:hypothetical protein|nr:DUF6477 family protein [Paracoccaceae bacterium]
MSDHAASLSAALSALRRPMLLVRAARFGLTEYRRDRDLRRLLPTATLPSPAAAVDQLLAAEEDAETRRREGAATYSAATHVELLVALLAEARLMARASAVAAAA